MDRSTAQNDNLDFPLLWNLSLLCFIIAGITGFGYRLGMAGELPFPVNLQNVRHAHSHLMFFGWAVPLPLYILFRHLSNKLPTSAPGITLMKHSIASGMFLGLAAYPFFLFYGYGPVPIASAAIPLSVILAGLVMVSWYCFVIGYLKVRKVLSTDLTQPWFDGSLTMLLVCSLGAWGVAALQSVAPANQLLTKAMTHFFLATFTEGWVVLAVIAVILKTLKLKEPLPLPSNMLLAFVVLGAPLTFPYGISKSLLTPILLITARIGGALAAAGLLLILFSVFKSFKLRHSIWKWPLGLLGLKAMMQLAASLLPSGFWLADHGLQIFYLHVLLLGALTLTIAGFLCEKGNAPRFLFNLFAGAVITVLLSLILMTRFWPPEWSGNWVFNAVAAAALLPVLAALVLWIKLRMSKSEKTYA
ncbi:MAG: hypothetical protein PVH63_08850 [Balneolaceae bacterium]|jgi:hypothetical protein